MRLRSAAEGAARADRLCGRVWVLWGIQARLWESPSAPTADARSPSRLVVSAPPKRHIDRSGLGVAEHDQAECYAGEQGRRLAAKPDDGGPAAPDGDQEAGEAGDEQRPL